MKDALQRVEDNLPTLSFEAALMNGQYIAAQFGHIDEWMDQAIERMADIALAQHNAGVAQALGDAEKATVG